MQTLIVISKLKTTNSITLKARNTQNHKFNFDIAFQIQEQKPQKFKILKANNKVRTKFESKQKRTDQK